MRTKKADKRKSKSRKNKRENNAQSQVHPHIHRSIVGITVIFVSILLIASTMFTSETGPFGQVIRTVLLGTFGIVGFTLPFIVLYAGWIISVKEHPRMYRNRLLCMLGLVILASCFLYLLFEDGLYQSQSVFAQNLGRFFEAGTQGEGGGAAGGLLTVPLVMTFGPAGAFIILMAASIITFVLATNLTFKAFLVRLKGLVSRVGQFCVGILSRKGKGTDDKSAAEWEGITDRTRINEAREKAPEIFDFAEREEAGSDHKPRETDEKSQSREAGSAEQVAGEGKENRRVKAERVKSAEVEELNLDHTALRKLDEDYKHPSTELLKSTEGTGKTGSKKELQDTAVKLEQTLSSFGVNAKVINVNRGPTVTRYELSPGAGVKVSKIVGLADDLALNLAAPAVRIEAPIPGKAAVGIEIPNREISPVCLRDVVESREFKNFPSNLAFAIGKDIAGRTVIGDIARMPHLLIAGATGSGKSVCINTLITSILYKARPDQVKLLMVDPKVVELGVYNGIPHLLIPVVTDPRKAAGALNWAVQEMVSRYNLFAEKGVRDIKGYNSVLKDEGVEALLPQVVIIIDELADLMMVAPNDVEDAICRLAQMARAAGMHLVVATQRPSVDVITGVIKANIPSRISFAVSSQVDSRTILDVAGAEKLLGKGDMLYYPVGEPKPIRLQGALISDKEVEAVVQYIKNQAEASYDEDIIEKLENEGERAESDPGDNDVLLPQAIDMVVETGQASISIIQRRFKVGYARAARLIDQMEARGIVGGFEGSKPRRVLVSKLQWEEMKAE